MDTKLDLLLLIHNKNLKLRGKHASKTLKTQVVNSIIMQKKNLKTQFKEKLNLRENPSKLK